MTMYSRFINEYTGNRRSRRSRGSDRFYGDALESAVDGFLYAAEADEDADEDDDEDEDDEDTEDEDDEDEDDDDDDEDEEEAKESYGYYRRSSRRRNRYY
jgi:hypothetical protein